MTYEIARLLAERNEARKELWYERAELAACRQETEQMRNALNLGRKFIATTSFWRQRKESRPEFEAFALAMLDIRESLTEERLAGQLSQVEDERT